MTKVLIAEDDLMIADMTEELLIEHGYDVCGIARTVVEAVSLARRHHPDLMLLDLRLAEGGLGTEVVAALAPIEALGILYATGNGSQVVLNATDGHACLLKPFRPHDLLRGLEIVSNLVTHGAARLPFPRGFQLLQPFQASAHDN